MIINEGSFIKITNNISFMSNVFSDCDEDESDVNEDEKYPMETAISRRDHVQDEPQGVPPSDAIMVCSKTPDNRDTKNGAKRAFKSPRPGRNQKSSKSPPPPPSHDNLRFLLLAQFRIVVRRRRCAFKLCQQMSPRFLYPNGPPTYIDVSNPSHTFKVIGCAAATSSSGSRYGSLKMDFSHGLKLLP